MEGLGNIVEDIQTIYSFILSPPPLPSLLCDIFILACWTLRLLESEVYSGVVSFQDSFYSNFFDSPVFCLTSYMSLLYHT